ncbi:MAG: sulfur oxidation c-type cytochrome SoxX [Sulfuricellaceae bacterium]|jgi:sulfur-oxidizing protein SoxX
MHKKPLGFAALALIAGTVAQAADLPPDATVNPDTKNKTVFPLPVQNSGTLKWGEHGRDLTKWTTLSPDDKRSIPKPRKVDLDGPLNGDPARGKEIAMNTSKGNCWACHALPGDAQPGSGGPSLLGFKKRGYSDAHVYQQISDPRVFNPQTIMPPFGTFEALTDQEVRDVAAFLQSIE